MCPHTPTTEPPTSASSGRTCFGNQTDRTTSWWTCISAHAAWFEARGQAVEVVRLHGSVELAPQVGLVDGIVDLTASGRTLRENKLRVAATLGSSTARLIGNQASLKTRTEAVQALVGRFREAANHGH